MTTMSKGNNYVDLENPFVDKKRYDTVGRVVLFVFVKGCAYLPGFLLGESLPHRSAPRVDTHKTI